MKPTQKKKAKEVAGKPKTFKTVDALDLSRAHDDLCRVLGVLPTTTWVEIFAEIGKLQAYRDIHDKIMESEVEDDVWPG